MSVAQGIAHPRLSSAGPRVADRRRERRQRLPGRCQRPSWQRRFEHFLCRERKEKHHSDVVYPEVQRMCDAIVGRQVKVRPYHCRNCSRQQQKRICKNKPDQPGTIAGHRFSEGESGLRSTAASRALSAASRKSIRPTRRRTCTKAPSGNTPRTPSNHVISNTNAMLKSISPPDRSQASHLADARMRFIVVAARCPAPLGRMMASTGRRR